MTIRTTIRLPEDLILRAKRKAVAEGTTLTALIEEGLRLAVAAPSKESSRERILPRVSEAKGGLLPGVDLTRFSDIQGQDDLEYAERLRRGFK
jgi:hypothetical protein